MGDCASCGACGDAKVNYCAACGLASGLGGTLLGIAPAVATGLFVAIVGASLAGILPVPEANDNSGFVESMLAAILGTTVPYFDLVFGFVGGWAAATALLGGGQRLGVASGGLVALGYLLTMVALAGHRDVAIDQRMLIAGTLPILGALLAGPLATPLAKRSRLGWMSDLIPGQRYVGIAIASFLYVAIAVVVYGLLLTALVIALALLAVYVVFSIIGMVMSEEGASRPSVAPSRFWPKPAPTPTAEAPPNALELLTREGKHGEQRGHIDKDGIIKDRHGIVEGRIDKDGIIKGKHGEFRGTIDKDGIVDGRHGEMLGSVDKNARVEGRHGEHKGKVQ